MHSSSYLYCLHRCCRVISEGLCVHGRPKCVQLTDGEIKLFTEVSVVPENSVVLTYAKLHLKNTSRFITAKPTSRSLLRDNSGVMYKDCTGSICYGQLQNVLLFEGDRESHGFAIIQHLPPALQGLCKDSVTSAGLNGHLVTLSPPRFVYIVM